MPVESLNHSVWECKYHVVFIPNYAALEPWLTNYRRTKPQPTAWRHFEWLKNEWQL